MDIASGIDGVGNPITVLARVELMSLAEPSSNIYLIPQFKEKRKKKEWSQ